MWKRFEKRLDTEMRFHLEQLIQDNIAKGLTPREARRRARLEFGDLELAKDEVRDLRPLEWLEQLGRDFKLAARRALRTPGFSLAVIAALTLGIGPNTAIFSIVYATLLAPLPYPQPDQLVILWSQAGGSRDGTSIADYLEWKKQATSFQYLEPISARGFNLSTPEAPERIRARQTTTDGHRMWGEDVFLGRDFAPDEDQPGKNRVVLLKHKLWRDRFGADPGIIGRDIRMDGAPYTIIGVLRPGVNDRLRADLWLPLSFTPKEEANRQYRPLMVLGRLKPGVTIDRAEQELKVIAGRLAQQYPDSNTGRSVTVEPLHNNMMGADHVRNLWLLLAAVSFVVLIACVNVANLLLSRGAACERQTAIRAALGATRGRLARLALTESLVLAAAGGTLGALSGIWILQGILGILPPGMLQAEADPRLNLPVLLFTLAATILSGLLCGAAQAWQASRANWNEALKQSGRSATGGGRRSFRHALVMVEFALAVTLLTGAGLTIQSFWKRTHVDLGVRTDHMLTFGLQVNEGRFSSPAEMEVFYRQLLDRFRSIRGVVDASLSADLPVLGTGFSRQFTVAGQAELAPSLRPATGVQIVTPEYFQTFGIRLVRGRVLTARDIASTQRVAVVNQRFVELFLDGRDPESQRVAMAEFVAGAPRFGRGAAIPGAPAEWHIVGVVRDVSNLDRFGDPAAPQVYLPFAQTPWPQMMAAVRTTSDPETLRRSLAAAVQSVDPELPLRDVRTMDQIVGEHLAPDRLNIALYGGLAVLALVLATLGIYGVMAFTVAQRRPEIGLRMALGAGQTQVRLQILREGLRLAAGGLMLGLIGAYVLGRAMQSTLYGTGALSLPVLLVVGLVLFGTALVACYLPARRASTMDPMIALRQE